MAEEPAHAIQRQNLTGVVLAGGQGQRMGGQDKGLLAWQGRPVITSVLNTLAPQVSTVLISANRNLDTYAELGRAWQVRVHADTLPGYAGPLAGILSAMLICPTPWLAVAPCDCPLLPADWVQRLVATVTQQAAPAAYAHEGNSTRQNLLEHQGSHYTVCLINTDLHDQLERDLAAGERRLGKWLVSVGAVAAAFGEAQAFTNLNTPQDWLAS